MIRITLALLASLALEATASAGTVTVRDNLSVLIPVEVDHLKKVAANWPFDVHFLMDDPAARGDLDAAVIAWTDGPEVMTVGVSPKLHYASVNFGKGVGVQPVSYRPIVMAGNERFLQKLYGLGVESVGDRAVATLAEEQPHRFRDRVRGEKVVPDATVRKEAPAEGVGATAVGLAAAATATIGMIGWAARRRRKQDGTDDTTDTTTP